MRALTTLEDLEMSHTMRRTYRRRVLRWLLASVTMATMGIGCHVHSPESRLTHSTTIRFFPIPRTAIDNRRTTPGLVDGYAYGYHQTQWRQWADEWIDDGVPLNVGPNGEGGEMVGPGSPSVMQPTPASPPAGNLIPPEDPSAAPANP